MSYCDGPDPADVLRDEDELLCKLMGSYIAHRETGAQLLLPHLEVRAEEFGRTTHSKLLDLILFYEDRRLA